MKGVNIWILVFLGFLAASNVINATIMWFSLGPTATFVPYILGGLIGSVPVYAYLLVSVLIALALFGVTSHTIVNEFSNKDKMDAISEKLRMLEKGQQAEQNLIESTQARVFLVDENIERTKNELSKGIHQQGESTKQSIETGHEDQQKTLGGIQARIFLVEESMKNVRKGLDAQGDVITSINANLASNVNPQLAEVKEIVVKQRSEIENSLIKLETSSKKATATIEKQKDEIAELKLKLEKLEEELTKPKPLLTSQSDVEGIKGIGPGKGSELRGIGIANVGELVMADPKVVAETMGSADKTVERLQGRAQLSMIPNIKEKDLLLLEEIDIMDRKSLAEQDPVDLARKINAAFKINVANGKMTQAEKPNIEDIYSWVRFARL